MLAAIQFDDQRMLTATEIGDEWSYGNLAAKLDPSQPAIAYCSPKFLFCFGGVGSQVPGAAESFELRRFGPRFHTWETSIFLEAAGTGMLPTVEGVESS